MAKVLFFAPHAAVWVHSFPEALVAEALAQHGHTIVYVTCDGLLDRFCVPMSANGLSPASSYAEKTAVCRTCRRAKHLLRKQFAFTGYDLEQLIEPAEKHHIESLVSSVTRENYLELIIDEVEVGRLALYELLLSRKKRTLDFTDEEWAQYQVQLTNALFSLVACKRVYERERPDGVVAYNSLYAVNHVAYRLAEVQSIPFYFLHAGGNLSRRLETLLIGRSDGVRFYEDLLAYWPRVAASPCPARLLEPITDHFVELLRGRTVFVYSAPRSKTPDELRACLGIPTRSQVLVATMSSLDERFAAETVGVMKPGRDLVFSSQVEWIQELLEYVKRRDQLFLVIRVHPREFPNKREGVKSEHASMLEQTFDHLPSNAVVNWPADAISLYDLAEVADVFLNAWSAAGKEMSLLGMPVVTYSADLLAYPPDLNYVGVSKEDYFAKIERALVDGWSIERTRATYRWCALEYERCAIDIRESFPQSIAARHTPRGLLERVLTRLNPALKERLDCLLRARRLRAASRVDQLIAGGRDCVLEVPGFDADEVSLEEETRILRVQVKRLLAMLYGDEPASPGSSRLRERLARFAYGA